MTLYVILGAGLIAGGAIWLAVFFFLYRKKTVKTTTYFPAAATDKDIAELEKAQRELRSAYIVTAVNTLGPCLLIGVGIFVLAIAVVRFVGLL